MAEIIPKILQPFLSKLGDELVNQVSYLCCYHCNVESLSDEIQKLEVERASLQQRVDAAERKSENILPSVKDWLEKASDTQTAAGRVLSEADDVRKCCLSKWCPVLHYSSSREAKKTIDTSLQLQSTASKFQSCVSTPVYPAALPPIPDASVIEFKSRERIEKEVMDALKDDSVYLIGLLGMGGVGKTTMAKNIRSKVNMTSMFETVIYAVVSRTIDLKDVQKQIAEGLGLPLEEVTYQIRAEKLYARLKEVKSFLIILDDVWKEIDLQNLGVPFKSSHGRGKIIMTSRVRDAFAKDAKIVTMDVLTEEEAWDLFREKAGYSDDGTHVLYETAKQVAKQCKGLPLALVVVGTALRNRSEPSWKDALRQLERNLPASNTPQVLQELYVPLKWSYDQLESEEARYIFLLCCLFPEDHNTPVETLVRYGWGLRIFSGIESISEARDRLEALVEMLKFRFLLIDAEYNYDYVNQVKMHDVVRDMAISIASKDPYVFLLNDERNKWPRKDSYENYTHISLKLKGIRGLPTESMNCPRLEFFRVESDWGERLQLPENFFASMGCLKVLELFRILSVPSSICLLTSLRELHLHNCDFESASFLSKLVNLEILSVRMSYFEELPKEFGSLTKLKLLDLTDCEKIVKIAPGVISGLVQLEELFMLDCNFSQWEAEEEGKERRNASLSEVASLRNMVNLKIEIENPKLLSLDSTNEPKMGTFLVRIGNCNMQGAKKYKKVIGCSCEEIISPRIGNFFGSIIRNAEYVWLEGDGCIGILNELAAEGFQKVKELDVEGCNNVEYLVNAFQMGPRNVVSFAALKLLSLVSCDSLKGISCLGHLPPAGSFCSLNSLKLHDLREFKQVFPLSTVESLSRLEDLHISYCPKMEEVFKEGTEIGITANNSVRFLKLRELRLVELPSLEAFCKGIESIEFPALETVVIGGVPEMKSFCITKCNQNQGLVFNKEVSCCNLKRINISKANCPMGIFDNGIPTANFSRLETLEVKYCPGLRNVFSPSMFRGLTNLKKLKLKDCEELKDIISPEEGGEGQRQVQETVFPQLKDLKLINLPNIHRFCPVTIGLQLPSLESVTIEDCPKMDKFLSESHCLPKLQKVRGIQDPDIATKLFFNKEKSSEEIHMDKTFFKLSPRDLSITITRGEEWNIVWMKSDSSDSIVPIAEMQRVVWGILEVNGRFVMANLSPGDAYEILYIIMLNAYTRGCEEPVEFIVTLPKGITHHRMDFLNNKPRGEWLELVVAEFQVEPDQIGELEFSVYHFDCHLVGGMLIQGVMIRQKSEQ